MPIASPPLQPLFAEVGVLALADGEATRSGRSAELIIEELLRRGADRRATVVRSRRRRRRRSRRLCRGVLHARHRLRAGADDLARASRLVRGRQDGDQPSSRQEHDRRVSSAAPSHCRHRDACAPCRGASSIAGLAEVIKYGVIADDSFLRLDRDEPRRTCSPAMPPPSATRSNARCEIKARVVAARRAGGRHARAPQLRSHLRPCDRGGPRLSEPGCTAKRSAAAWCWARRPRAIWVSFPKSRR